MSIRVGLRHMARSAMAKPEVIIDEWRKAANIFSTYSLCSTVPFEELTVQPTSAYFLCIEQKEYITVSPTSEYDLAVA